MKLISIDLPSISMNLVLLICTTEFPLNIKHAGKLFSDILVLDLDLVWIYFEIKSVHPISPVQ